MDFLDSIFGRFSKTITPLNAGVHHFQSPPDAENAYRMHLRLENDGSGVLILNAHTILHLNQTAAEYAFHLVNQTSEQDVTRQISKRYRIDRKQVQTDFLAFKGQIETLVKTPDLDPETYFGFDREQPYSRTLSAPYRLDCALTYRSTDEDPDSVLSQRVKKELDTEEWKKVLVKAWDAGIPHVIFTGGEPTLREDLAELIGTTQEIGQVSGLLTDGLRLGNKSYLKTLLEKGLDHIMVVLDVNRDEIWEAITVILAEDIHLTVHLTLDDVNVSQWKGIIEQLADLGVYAISLSASSPEHKNELILARRTLTEKGINLVWDLPVPFSHLHPAALENEDGEELTSGAGKAWLYVEPDGDVLPCQGMANKVLGNMVENSWDSIWKNAGLQTCD